MSGQPKDTPYFDDLIPRNLQSFLSGKVYSAEHLVPLIKNMDSQQLVNYMTSLRTGRTWHAGGPELDQLAIKMIERELDSRRPQVQGTGLLKDLWGTKLP